MYMPPYIDEICQNFQLSGLRCNRDQILLDRTYLLIGALVVVLVAVVVVAGDVGVLPDGVGCDAGGRLNWVSIHLFLQIFVLHQFSVARVNLSLHLKSTVTKYIQPSLEYTLVCSRRYAMNCKRNMGG